MKRKVAAAIALTFVALAAPAQEPSPSASPEATPDARVEATRRELDAIREKIAAATEKEAALVEALDQLEQEMASRTEELEAIQKQIDEGRRLSEEKREKMEQLEKRIEGKREWLKSRLRSTYIHGRPGILKVIFASESYADLVRRTKFSRILAQRDSELIDELEDDLEEVAQSRIDYEKDLALFESALSESRATNEELEVQRQVRKELLASVRTEAASYAGMKDLLEKRHAELAATIGEIDSAAVPGTRNFLAAKASLLPPVKKPVVMRPFGTYTHPAGGRMMHQGIAYTCAIGDPVRAVFDGRVEMSMYWSTYGQMLAIDHGDGWRSIYAHNSKRLKQKGDVVREGELIAECGDTGSLEGPFLFFGLFQKNQPVDPAEWLVK